MNRFETIAPHYDTPERIRIATIIADKIRQAVTHTEDKQLLDFGCGTGQVSLQLHDVFQHILCTDTAPSMIELISGKITAQNLSNVEALCCDLLSDDALDFHPDYILVSQVLLHIPDTKLILSRLYSLLNPGGHLVIVDFDKNPAVPSDEIHNGFDQRELTMLAEQYGFINISSETFYHGTQMFMNQDASLFLMDVQKPRQV